MKMADLVDILQASAPQPIRQKKFYAIIRNEQTAQVDQVTLGDSAKSIDKIADFPVAEDASTTDIAPIPVSEQQCDLICTTHHSVDPFTCSCVPLTEHNEDTTAGSPTDETSTPEYTSAVDDEFA